MIFNNCPWFLSLCLELFQAYLFYHHNQMDLLPKVFEVISLLWLLFLNCFLYSENGIHAYNEIWPLILQTILIFPSTGHSPNFMSFLSPSKSKLSLSIPAIFYSIHCNMGIQPVAILSMKRKYFSLQKLPIPQEEVGPNDHLSCLCQNFVWLDLVWALCR